MFSLLAEVDSLGTIGAALAGGGLGTIVLAVINGYWRDKAAARDHDLRKAVLARYVDIKAKAIDDLFNHAGESREWAQELTEWLKSATKTTEPPRPPDMPAKPIWPTSSGLNPILSSGHGWPEIGNDTPPAS